MPATHAALLARITVDPGVRFGKPCIRGHRITVQEILEWLSKGTSQERILAEYPQLEPGRTLQDLFPGSESALRNGLARTGDRRILDYASAHGFILVSTDSDFARLLLQIRGAVI